MWSKRGLPSREAIGDYVMNCPRVDVWIDDVDTEFVLRDVTPTEKLTDEQLDKMESSYCWGVRDGKYVLLYPNLLEIKRAVHTAYLND